MLTYAYILIVQLCRAVAVEAQAAVLAVLAPRVVLAAHAGHHVQEVDVAAAVGVAVALAVCREEEERERGGGEKDNDSSALCVLLCGDGET